MFNYLLICDIAHFITVGNFCKKSWFTVGPSKLDGPLIISKSFIIERFLSFFLSVKTTNLFSRFPL